MFIKARKTSGFTLIEILVVLSIVGILIAASVPMLMNVINSSRIKNEAQKIVSDLRVSQELATTKKATCVVTFKGRSLFYKTAKYTVDLYDYFKGKYVTEKIIELPKGFDFAEDKVIKFSHTGSPIVGFSGTIILRDQSLRERKIIISPIGRIRSEQ